MPDALLITGLIGDQVCSVTCTNLDLSGSEPVANWLLSELGATPYSIEAVRELVPELPRLFGTVLEVVDYTDASEAPMPVLTEVEPRSMPAGGADVTLRALGRSFVPRSQIVFNGGVETTVFVGPTELTTIVTGATATTPGDYAVQVTTDEPGGGMSDTLLFAILPPEEEPEEDESAGDPEAKPAEEDEDVPEEDPTHAVPE